MTGFLGPELRDDIFFSKHGIETKNSWGLWTKFLGYDGDTQPTNKQIDMKWHDVFGMISGESGVICQNEIRRWLWGSDGGLQVTYCTYIPIGSMYGIFNYIWVILRANVDKYSIYIPYMEHMGDGYGYPFCRSPCPSPGRFFLSRRSPYARP